MKTRGIGIIAALAAIGLGLAWYFSRLTTPPVAAHAVASSPQRIICAAPSITEAVFALGQGARVAGVTDYCTYPPEVLQSKPRIGGLHNPNRERILKLQPDLIIYIGDFAALQNLAKEHSIATLRLEMNSLEQIRTAIGCLGEALGCPQNAAEVLSRFDAELEEVRQRVAGRAPRKVYLCTEHRPADLAHLGTCSADSFLAEAVAIAGGENIFADAVGGWPQVSKEALLKRSPEIIIELHPQGMGSEPETFATLRQDWATLPQIPAVQRGEIHFLTDDYLFIPSVRAPQIARRLAALIHQEAFAAGGIKPNSAVE